MNKNILLLLLILISSSLAAQQNDKSEVVFPIKGKSIRDCYVISVGPGNMVNYKIEKDTLSILSKAYIKDGELINVFYNEGFVHEEFIRKSDITNQPELNFEENRDYYYHANQYKKYRKRSLASIPFLAGGLAFFAGGAAWHFHEKDNLNYDNIPYEDRPAFVIMALGGASLIAGTIIVTINSSIAQQHKREMKKIESNTVTVNLSIQPNGLGINIKF